MMTQNNDLKEYPAQRKSKMIKDRFQTFDGLARYAQKLTWKYDALIKKSKEDGVLIKILTAALQGVLHDNDGNSYQIAKTAIAAANLRLQESE